jgi:hypothetical protein
MVEMEVEVEVALVAFFSQFCSTNPNKLQKRKILFFFSVCCLQSRAPALSPASSLP